MEFEVGDYTDVVWQDGWYLAKIVDVKPKDEVTEDNKVYYVHYHKWPKKYDEWVEPDRVKSASEEHLAAAQSSKRTEGSVTSSRKREFSVTSTPMSVTKGLSRRRTKEMELPEELEIVLVNGWEDIHLRRKLHDVPPSSGKTISHVLHNEYIPGVQEEYPGVAAECVRAMIAFFDTHLPQQLLYEAEIEMGFKYDKKKLPSQQLGCGFFVRFLSLFPTVMADQISGKANTKTTQAMRHHYEEIRKFLLSKASNPIYFE